MSETGYRLSKTRFEIDNFLSDLSNVSERYGGVYSALSNKVSKSSDTPCPNLDEFVELYQYVNVTPDTENLPVATSLDFGSAINIGLSSGIMIQILYSRYGDIFVRGHAYWEIPKWRPWAPIVTATPPQVYDLPLGGGVSGTALFFKTKESNVQVIISSATKSAWGIGELIGTLPEGYCPQVQLYFPLIVTNGSVIVGNCSMSISPDGSIRIAGYNVSGGTEVGGFATFIVKTA